MLKTYFKIALRKLRKNKLYAAINLIGLTIGITSCILIGLYVFHELSFDRFHKNGERIVRLTSERNGDGSINKYATTGTKVGPFLKRTFPKVEAYTRTIKYSLVTSNGPDKTFDEKHVLFADTDFFNIFSFHLLQGDTKTVLGGPKQAVLTASTAKKYFGNTEVVGKSLRIGASDYTITGIAADAPGNSQIQFNIIASFSTLGVARTEKWSEANYITYLLLDKNASIPALEKQEMDLMKSASIKQDYGAAGDQFMVFHMEPLLQVHLHSDLDGLEPNTNSVYVYILAAIAILILIIACVNYTNLAVAQSSSRGTEIGIRKVLGARKGQLFGQFIGEAALLSGLALLLSVLASVLLLPVFNQVAGKSFNALIFLQPLPIAVMLLCAVCISFIAGAYPALVLSNTKLTNILKSGVRLSSSGGSLRKSLIIFQFVVSVFLMIATTAIIRQLNFIRHKDIGYNKDQVLVLPVDQKTRALYQSLKLAFEDLPQVKSVTGAYETPIFVQWGDGVNTDASGAKKGLSINAMPVQLDFIKTMGMQLLAGTDFTAADLALMDTANNYKNFQYSFILNQKAAGDLGWTPAEAVGKTIYKGAPGKIKAVVKDFNFASLHQPVGDMILFADTSLTREMYVKLQGSNIAGGLAVLQNTWKKFITHRPFQYRFLDDDYNGLYQTEQQSAALFSVFSCIAILLACLGLFALAAYATVQRTKEIGIRKILGADISGIIFLVAREFLQLVAIAVIIAAPLAWYASKRWLDNFAYRTNMQLWIFAAAGFVALFIALLTVGYHAFRAAVKNPVNALRTE